MIIRFTLLNETYYLKSEDLFYFIKNEKRVSIPISYFKEKAYLIKDKYNPRCDFLKIIDYLYFGGKYE